MDNEESRQTQAEKASLDCIFENVNIFHFPQILWMAAPQSRTSFLNAATSTGKNLQTKHNQIEDFWLLFNKILLNMKQYRLYRKI